MTAAVMLATEPAAPFAPTSCPSGLEELVAAVIGGDCRAREQLLAEIHPPLLRYCRGRLGRRETALWSAEDVAQEVCLAVIAALPNYQLKGLSFRAFIYGIAAHKVADVFRAIKRNRVQPVAELPDTPSEDHGPDQHVIAAEDTEKLRELLHPLMDSLTERQREVLVLRVTVGLGAEETAQAVRSTAGAVRVIQHRALNRLRAALVEAGLESPAAA